MFEPGTAKVVLCFIFFFKLTQENYANSSLTTWLNFDDNFWVPARVLCFVKKKKKKKKRARVKKQTRLLSVSFVVPTKNI